MTRRFSARFAGLVVLSAILAAACGGNGDDGTRRPTATPPGTTTVTQPNGTAATPTAISELKVALINLHAPLSQEPNGNAAADTFATRVKMVAEEIKRLDPDIIAFNEASVTRAGNAIDLLVAELKLEPAYMRANPGFGLDNAQAEQFVKQLGFEEGELLFSRYPILEFERIPLSPRSSELGLEGRIALYARIKAPAPLGEINVFVTHLTGGGPDVREAQAQDLVRQIGDALGDRPTLVIGDMGDAVDSETFEVFRAAGFQDAAWEKPLATCCRQGITGDQAEPMMRTDAILARGFGRGSVQLFAQHPVVQMDGTKLYASDHNGLFVVLSVSPG